MNKAEQMMVEDGLPAGLLRTAEQRAAWWKANPPRAMPIFQDKPRGEDEATLPHQRTPTVNLDTAREAPGNQIGWHRQDFPT